MRSLLFIDDDRDDVTLTLMGLRAAGLDLEVVLARDGREALDLLEADYAGFRPLPAVILTDLKMPRMDGLELLRRLKEDPRLRHIPVAFLTSSGNEDDRLHAVRSGAVEYFRKPSNIDDYADIAARVRSLAAPASA